MAYVFRLSAGALDEMRRRDWVRTAAGKGLDEGTIFRRHILPNAGPVIVAAVVLAAQIALSSLPVIEFVFVWGGIGLSFVQAIASSQAALAASFAITFAVALGLLNIASDFAQQLLGTRSA
jgi:ABC-type dipeptide/oligopeptide/nickel transport system permease component